MKKIDCSYVVTRICVALLLLSFLGIIGKLVTNHLGIGHGYETTLEQGEPNGTTRIDMDWEAYYPFEAETVRAEENANVSKTKGEHAGIGEETQAISSGKDEENILIGYVNTIEKKIRDYSSKELIGYEWMNEVAKAWDKLLRWEITGVNEYNPVMSLESDYFIAPVEETEDVEGLLSSMMDLEQLLENKGIPFLYVQTPYKICREDAEVVNVVDFSNRNIDNVLKVLGDHDIPYLDLRENLHRQEYPHHELFFSTDHHWKPESGLWATGEIAKTLVNDFGIDLDIEQFAQDNYYSEVYKDYFLGSQGKKATLAVAKPEDISIIYPKEKQQLRIEIPSLQIDKEGDFSILYDYVPIARKDYYNLDPYAAYIYSNNDLTRIYNDASENDTKILVFGDSFDNVIIPFLALGASQVDSIDLRVFDGSVKRYIQQNDYDMVIVIWAPTAIKWYENADHKTLYDFR